MNEIKLQKNFDRWCKTQLDTTPTEETRAALWKMYVYFIDRLEHKDNRIQNLEAQIKQLKADLEFQDESWRYHYITH